MSQKYKILLITFGCLSLPITISAENSNFQNISIQADKVTLNKKMSQLTLMGQEFIKDPDITIEQLLNDSNAKVNSFIRYEVGDGIEQEEVNFADEVKAQVEATQ